jgi:hypothetical protein
LLINAIFPVFILSTGLTSVFDNERLFMPTFIFLAALAAIGLDWALSKLGGWLVDQKRVTWRTAANTVLLALAFIPQIVSATGLYPHLLSYYSITVGGLPGATSIGLETTYWCETYYEALDYINQYAEPGEVIWADPFSHDVLFYYMKLGRLRDDLSVSAHPQAGSQVFKDAPMVDVSFEDADFIMLQYRQSSTTYLGWGWPILDWVADQNPVIRITHQGIPLFELYHQIEN